IKSIIDGVKNGLIVFDLNGKITWANTRILDIFSDQMVLNQYLYELLTDINFEVLLEEIKRFNIFITDIAIQQLEFKCVITPISIEPVHYVAVFNDITDLKKIDRLKSDMIRMVSHELKNPLLAINICAENIVDIQEKNFVIENAQNIIQASSVLMNIITNFLNLSRLENNMIEFNKEPADLIEIINECISLQLPIAKEKGIDIIFENENIAEVLIDKTQITIVINNLLSNALKYSINSNKVIVKTYTEEEFIKTSIIDFGIGIPQEDLDKIFETFFRSINNKKNNIEGSGLGLSIIKRILLLHNGDISVTSKVNEGSIFTFKLPAQNLSTAINQETK
ncbi:MAG: PAS domain-containing sensor histidine kinase, partial [Cyanobacteriota bacterium]